MKKLAVPEAIAVLIGTIIGAGVFTLPYVAAQAGIATTLIWLVVVSFIILYLHLGFGEIVLRTKGDFRLPGYVGHYLNSPAKKLALITTFFTFSFSLLVYLLLGSQFLHVIFSSLCADFSFPQGFLVIILWLIFSVMILSRGEKLSRVNFYLSFAILLLFFVIAVFAIPHFQAENLNFFHSQNGWGWLIPYGVLFFALNGLVAVPEAAKSLKIKGGDQKNFKKVVMFGTLIPAFCYLIFILSVVGASGSATTLEAIQGLQGILGNSIVVLGAVLGFLAVATSYLIFASYIKNSFVFDFRWSNFISCFLVTAGPLLLYFLQLDNLVNLISFIGGMLGGFEGVLVVLILQKAKEKGELNPPYQMPWNKTLATFLIVALVAGALCQTFLVY